MAFTDNTTFNGKEAEGFYSAALLTGDTKSIIKSFVNVKSKLLVGRVDLSDLLQDADCTYTDGGDTTLSQKTLEVCPIKVNKTFCQRTFEANYLSAQLKAGSNSDGSIVPDSFEDYILELMAKNISADLENTIWNGTTGATGICQGFLDRFDNDGSIVGLTAQGAGLSAGVALSVDNIVTVLSSLYSNIPASVMTSDNMTIFMGPSTAAFYKLAQATVATGSGSYFLGDKEMNFLGIPIVVSKRIAANVIVAADSQNLWFGTDLMSDFEDIMVLPMKSVTGAPEYRFVAEFKFGVNYGIPEEIVYYTST